MPLSLLSISVRPAFTAFRMPNGYGPSGRLRSALEAARAFALLAALSLHLAVDHQMTPTLFAGASRASRLRPAHWRIGCRASLREPTDLKHHAFPG